MEQPINELKKYIHTLNYVKKLTGTEWRLEVYTNNDGSLNSGMLYCCDHESDYWELEFDADISPAELKKLINS